MLNDFIGGGQIFLHKIRMFMQVLDRSFYTSLILSLAISGMIAYPDLPKYDWKAAWSYQKAGIAEGFDDGVTTVRRAIKNKGKQRFHTIDAYTKKGLYARDILPYKILKAGQFIQSYDEVIKFIKHILFVFVLLKSTIFILIFILWSKFGKNVKEQRHISGAKIKTAKEVAGYLRAAGKAGSIYVGDMPLVKNSETRHIIVTGSTGSGKTNLINNILPQVIRAKHPSIVIDQTGEMIAKYYDESRGDIIFNPLDNRSHSWDFWTDNSGEDTGGNINSRLEKFAKVLFKYGKKPYSGSDPFWDNSAEVIFCSCVEYLSKTGNKSIKTLQEMLSTMPLKQLEAKLIGTKSSRYLSDANKTTASSILSVMTTNTKPLDLLTESGNKFSLREYFTRVREGGSAWLFLSSPPDLREVTMPLLASFFELSVSHLIGMGIKEDRRIWFIIDELSALGKLNGFNTLMSEGRKYGACVLAATQSISQLFENFGMHSASSIFGQFATKFIFRTDEPAATKIIADIFGELEYRHQQKNTSFGANEFRDGISYTEQQRSKSLISSDTLASLEDLECFVGLPEPRVRIARIKVPLAKISDKHQGFILQSGDNTVRTDNIKPSIATDNDNANENNRNEAAVSEHNNHELSSLATYRLEREDQLEQDITDSYSSVEEKADDDLDLDGQEKDLEVVHSLK